jgi:putative transposase
MGIAANWLGGDLVAAAPNRKWTCNMTCICSAEGLLYIVVVLIDMAAVSLTGPVSDRMKKERQSVEG